jgi:hypothetical protein
MEDDFIGSQTPKWNVALEEEEEKEEKKMMMMKKKVHVTNLGQILKLITYFTYSLSGPG